MRNKKINFNNIKLQVFLAHGKFVVLSAHRLVHIGDTVHRNVTRNDVRTRVLQCANALNEALAQTVQKTKQAAQFFPSVTAVQEMVDSVVDVSHLAKDLKVAMIQSAQQPWRFLSQRSRVTTSSLNWNAIFTIGNSFFFFLLNSEIAEDSNTMHLRIYLAIGFDIAIVLIIRRQRSKNHIESVVHVFFCQDFERTSLIICSAFIEWIFFLV